MTTPEKPKGNRKQNAKLLAEQAKTISSNQLGARWLPRLQWLQQAGLRSSQRLGNGLFKSSRPSPLKKPAKCGLITSDANNSST